MKSTTNNKTYKCAHKQCKEDFNCSWCSPHKGDNAVGSYRMHGTKKPKSKNKRIVK